MKYVSGLMKRPTKTDVRLSLIAELGFGGSSCIRHGKGLQEWRLRSGVSILEGLGAKRQLRIDV